MSSDVFIIGAGAAGLFCAVRSAWAGNSVVIAEHEDRPAKKLEITGRGRCNVTNNCDVRTVMENIPRNAKFLYSALSRFSPEDTMAFFESLGVKLKTERGNRVFPVSDSAKEISHALIDAAKQAGVKFVHDDILSLIIENGKAVGARGKKRDYFAKKTVVACGGLSYPKTGSRGSGYRLARQAGHTVTELRGSLVPVELCGDLHAQAMGLSLKNCTLSLKDEKSGRIIYSELGEMLFTHYGMSGPLVLSASAHMDDISPGRYSLIVDLKPALDEKKLDARLLRDLSQFPNRELNNSLNRLLPSSIIPVVIAKSGVDGAKRVNSLTRAERMELVRAVKSLTFTVKRLRPPEEAVITRGGVDVKQLDPKTMGSRLVSGLYFIGEVIDADAYTGGFNLQIAFATAAAVSG